MITINPRLALAKYAAVAALLKEREYVLARSGGSEDYITVEIAQQATAKIDDVIAQIVVYEGTPEDFEVDINDELEEVRDLIEDDLQVDDLSSTGFFSGSFEVLHDLFYHGQSVTAVCNVVRGALTALKETSEILGFQIDSLLEEGNDEAEMTMLLSSVHQGFDGRAFLQAPSVEAQIEMLNQPQMLGAITFSIKGYYSSYENTEWHADEDSFHIVKVKTEMVLVTEDVE